MWGKYKKSSPSFIVHDAENINGVEIICKKEGLHVMESKMLDTSIHFSIKIYIFNLINKT